MTGVGVKVTLLPAQMVVCEARMLTAGTNVVLTVIVMLLLVAVVGLAQAELEVITQLTTLPLAREEVV